jgi:hypothetical protein
MSCPSSRTRTPDNGRLVVLSLGDESLALTEGITITDHVEISYGTVTLTQQYYNTHIDDNPQRLTKARDAADLLALNPIAPGRLSIIMFRQ